MAHFVVQQEPHRFRHDVSIGLMQGLDGKVFDSADDAIDFVSRSDPGLNRLRIDSEDYQNDPTKPIKIIGPYKNGEPGIVGYIKPQ